MTVGVGDGANRSASPAAAAVAALVALAALLRFPWLDAKSFWRDEAYTVLLVRMDLRSMLHAIPRTEGTPPLYYLLAWGWSQLFGSGEVGLRSLSALLGVAVVPVAYLAGREAVSRRTGLVAAALVAVNPLLVWYSQEARAYILLVLLGGVSFLFFLRSLRTHRPRDLAWWALSSALALATHWFAPFTVAVEGVWLLASVRPRRRVLLACGSVAAIGMALIPLLRQQGGDGRGWQWIAEMSLLGRVVELPGIFLVGFEAPAPVALAGGAAAFAAVGLWALARRSRPQERRGALVAASVAAVATGAPLALALVGLDLFFYRNLLAAAVPLAVFLAAGLAVPPGAGAPVADWGRPGGRQGSPALSARAVQVALGALMVLSIVVVLSTSWEPKYHREDWRDVARALGPARVDRAIVMTPAYGPVPLAAYMPGIQKMSPAGERVREVVLLGTAREDAGSLAPPSVPRAAPRPPAPATGLKLVELRRDALFTLVRYRAADPVRLPVDALAAEGVGGTEAEVMVQPAP